MPATGDGADKDRLEKYRAKRSLDRTPEPSGGARRLGGSTYVFHKHAATHLHWDLRLEFDGVLFSWAVPKGPSFDTAEKRLAVHVEDHPLEYGDFEGRIPEGNYGAGAVIIWDRGAWIPKGDPAEGLAKGKLLFELRGYKLRGLWTLVKIKKGEREWLLIKERDAYAVEGGKEIPEASVLSGLTVEDLKGGVDPGDAIRGLLQELGAPRQSVDLGRVTPMLAETAAEPFTASGWSFELKLDGYRILAGAQQRAATLRTRNGRDATESFPEIARAIGALPFDRFLLDGEVVAVDDAGRPSFQRLQQRAQYLRPMDLRRAAVTIPVTYYAFDLLAFEDFDLRPLPLTARKDVLRRLLPPAGPIPFLEHFPTDGERLFQQVQQMGLEGVVAKREDAAYQQGRSGAWLKIRSDRTGDFVVVGYTLPGGTRVGFGALHLGEFADGRMTYVGRVGTGFSDELLTELRHQLDALSCDGAACEVPHSPGDDDRWVRPELVAEIRYKEWTEQALLRHPVFLRLRDDKSPTECERTVPKQLEEEPPVLEEDPPEARTVRFSNLDKVFWPEEGYTKRDLITYYEAIGEWMLPYLADRPLVLTRYPDGINGKSFFQKDAPKFAPDWLRRESMWSEHAGREISYFICDDIPSLLYIANMAAIPLHVWASRVTSLERPDWCVLDLDPKEASFSAVIQVAQAIRTLCDDLDYPSYVKTTGSTGLHVLVPVARQMTHEQSRTLGELLARVIVKDHPEVATITRVIDQRDGKVYLDYLQNGHGKLIVAPFALRPVPKAQVAMPLSWDEVAPGLRLDQFTLDSAPQRMQDLQEDPMASVLRDVPDLSSVLARLQQRM